MCICYSTVVVSYSTIVVSYSTVVFVESQFLRSSPDCFPLSVSVSVVYFLFDLDDHE